MYINSYKYISFNDSELPDLVNNSFDEIQAIENIKNSLKRSAEEFEATQLLKKTKLVSSTPVSNLSYLTDILTNDISYYIEQGKNSSSNTNEVSEIIDKEIEFLCAQKSSIKDDTFQKIIEELFPCELINTEMTIESEICDPIVLSSKVDQQTHLQSSPSTDILSLAWSMAVLSSDTNLESQAKQSDTSFTNDVSSSHPPHISEAKEGKRLTQETKQKISETLKRRWANPETRQMMLEAQKYHTQETRQKMSEAKKGRHLTAEAKQKLSEARKGKRLSEETKRKMSEAKKGRRLTQETRQKMSETRRGRHRTQETKQRISEAKKGRHLTQETKQRISEAKKGRHLTQEAK